MADETPLTDGRDGSSGKFVKGNKFGTKGSPHAARIAEFKKCFFDHVSTGDWIEIIDKAVADAKAGDRAARDWISDRTIGKVANIVEASVNGSIDPSEALDQLSNFFGLGKENKSDEK